MDETHAQQPGHSIKTYTSCDRMSSPVSGHHYQSTFALTISYERNLRIDIGALLTLRNEFTERRCELFV